MVGYGKKTLKVAAQLLHRARRKATDGHCEVQAARRPRARSARAVTEHVGLVPQPVTDWAAAYLWVCRVGGDGPVFTVPAEVPEAT